MENTTNKIYRFPVSVKGIIVHNNRVLLLKNERNEWELPGGKLELGETVEECLKREIREETTLNIDIQEQINTWVYTIFAGAHVLIVTYACSKPAADLFHISDEHKEGRWFDLDNINCLNMPQGYKNSIAIYRKLKLPCNIGQ